MRGKTNLIRRLAERFDALGAQCLFDQTALLHHRHLLQVGLELAICRMQRERTVMPEGGCLATGIALSHLKDPFRTMIPVRDAFSKARDFTIDLSAAQEPIHVLEF